MDWLKVYLADSRLQHQPMWAMAKKATVFGHPWMLKSQLGPLSSG